MAEIGWATLGVIPSFRDFGGALQRGTSKSMTAAGIAGGATFGDHAGRSASRTFGSRFSSGIKTVGLLGGIGAAVGIGDFIRDSVTLEAEFGRTMSQIRVATDAPADRLQRLDDLAIKLGKDTIFSASDASEAMLELAKNGIRPATIEAGALDSALTLAAAGGVDMETAATTMGNALNAFGLKGRRAKSVAAALAGAANASSASVGSLAEGLQQSSASANDMGFNVQETTGALAAFANAGISGSDAGTSLKTMLSRLVPQTDKAQKAMEHLGIDFTDSNGEILSMTEVAGQLHSQLADLSTEERSTALNTLFGSDARRAATVLMKEGADGLRDYIKATSDQGAAERMAKANMEGTAGSIERLKGAWETTKLEFGKSIAPVAADFLDALADNLDDVAPKLTDFGEWFTDEGMPKIKDFAHFMKDDVLPVVEDLGGFAKDAAGFLNDLPKEVKIGGLGALAALFVGSKLRGGGGLLGSAGSALGLTKPVPVFVTNAGAGDLLGAGAGGKAGKGDKPSKGIGLGRAVVTITAAYFAADAITKILGWKEETPAEAARRRPFERKQNVGPDTLTLDEKARERLADMFKIDGTGLFGLMRDDKGLSNALVKQDPTRLLAVQKMLRKEYGLTFQDLEKQGLLIDGTADALTGLLRPARETAGVFNTFPKDLKTEVMLNGADVSRKQARDLVDQYNLTPKQKSTLFKVLDIDRNKQTMKTYQGVLGGTPRDVKTHVGLTGVPEARTQIRGLSGALADLASDASAAIDAAADVALGRGRGGSRPRNAGRDQQRRRNLGGTP